ncbi:hypothetical protein ACFOKI_06725 [Sphingomonas qilianensis]|uniref:Uncharacterized protein n=1 Tax=Sphingomonas qilianensis TaxID=1736690 RepID=A0ABU9XQI6_9SPHN
MIKAIRASLYAVRGMNHRTFIGGGGLMLLILGQGNISPRRSPDMGHNPRRGVGVCWVIDAVVPIRRKVAVLNDQSIRHMPASLT